MKKYTCRSRSRVATAIAALGILFGMATPIAANAATPAISIPTDEGPHNTGLEWWYFTGQLTGKDENGVVHHYGYELTFFKPELTLLSFPAEDTYIAHLAITDINRNTHPFEQHDVTQPDNIIPGGGFNINDLGYEMMGKNGSNYMSATTSDGDYSLQLSLHSLVPKPALHGDGGIIPYGPIPSSYYYSWTNLATVGTIMDHGQKIQVTGSSWFDHQWFDYVAGTPMGWDWFAIKLDNDSQVMLYFLRDWTGNIVQTVGTLVNPDGSTVALPSSALADKATGSWFSTRTMRTYSSGWTVTIPGGELNITPRVKDQEMYLPPLPTYWEGACTVSGTYNNAPITGEAYTEITPPQIFF